MGGHMRRTVRMERLDERDLKGQTPPRAGGSVGLGGISRWREKRRDVGCDFLYLLELYLSSLSLSLSLFFM